MVKFKLPITLADEKRGVFLGTVEGVYFIGLFEWRKSSNFSLYSHDFHQEYFILPTKQASMKLYKELKRLQKDEQRLRSKWSVRDYDFLGNKEYKQKVKPIVEEAFNLVTQYVNNPPSPLIRREYPHEENWINEQLVRALDNKDKWVTRERLISDDVPRWMWMVGRTLQGKTLNDMKIPKIDALRQVTYVSINYFQLPNRHYNRKNSLLPNTLITSMMRHHLK
jgi:hypothetical protein